MPHSSLLRLRRSEPSDEAPPDPPAALAMAVTLELDALPGAVTSVVAAAFPPATPGPLATLPPPAPIAVLTP